MKQFANPLEVVGARRRIAPQPTCNAIDGGGIFFCRDFRIPFRLDRPVALVKGV
jgi:hypothetical protein